jgi:hypothetical protein
MRKYPTPGNIPKSVEVGLSSETFPPAVVLLILERAVLRPNWLPTKKLPCAVGWPDKRSAAAASNKNVNAIFFMAVGFDFRIVDFLTTSLFLCRIVQQFHPLRSE